MTDPATLTDAAPAPEPDDGDGLLLLEESVTYPQVPMEVVRYLPPVQAVVPAKAELEALAQLATTLAAADAVPVALRNKPNDVFLVLLSARDLGTSLTTALREFHVIQGRVTLSPKVKLAMVNERGRAEGWAVWPDPDNDADGATWYATRTDRPGVTFRSTFHWEDAQRAGMVRWDCEATEHCDKCKADWGKRDGKACKDNYRTHPARMVSWRALGYLLDDAFPEVGTGLYCVPTRAEALTRDGWMTHDKVAVGDEVLAYDAEANVCRWVPVQNSRCYPAQPTFRLAHNRWAFTTTADHRWFVQRKDGAGRRERGREVRTTLAMEQGRGGTVVLAAPSEPQHTTVSIRDAAILGWVLTDGWMGWGTNGRGTTLYPRVRISQSKHVDGLRRLLGPDASERLHTGAVTQTIKGREYECRAAYSFELRAKFLRGWMDRCGIKEKADAIATVTRMTAEGRQAMLDAMMLGNGHDAGQGPTGQQHRTFHTGRRDVLDTFQALCAAHGQALGRERFANGCWTVTLRRSRGIEVADLRTEPAGLEDVWCLTTSLGSWVCRLDGYVSITGNSPDEMGVVTDQDGVPVIDVTEVEPYAGHAAPRGRRKKAEPPVDEPISDDDLEAIKARIAAIITVTDARDALNALWYEKDENDRPKLPKPDALLARYVVRAKAVLDSIEARLRKDEWGTWDADPTKAPESPEPAPVPPSGPPPAGGGQPVPEAPSEPQSLLDVPAEVIEDVGRTHPALAGGESTPFSDDLQLAQAVRDQVNVMPLSEVQAALKAAKVKPAGNPDADRKTLAALLYRERGGNGSEYGLNATQQAAIAAQRGPGKLEAAHLLVSDLDDDAVDAECEARGLGNVGSVEQRRVRLAEAIAAEEG